MRTKHDRRAQRELSFRHRLGLEAAELGLMLKTCEGVYTVERFLDAQIMLHEAAEVLAGLPGQSCISVSPDFDSRITTVKITSK